MVVCPITSRIRAFGTSVVLPPGLPVFGAETLEEVCAKLAVLLGCAFLVVPAQEAVKKFPWSENRCAIAPFVLVAVET
jgi:hypothetical protein